MPEGVGGVPTRTRDDASLAFLLGSAVFAAVACLQLLDAVFLNDHFDRISRGRQIWVHGELPFRDFFDPGYLATLFVSAVAQAGSGHTLLGEAAVSIGAIALGVALVAVLAWHATRSVPVALAMTALAVAAAPRLYDYDKVLFYTLGLWSGWRVIERPTRSRLYVLAAVTIAGGLFRYDTALYVGGAAVVAVGASAASRKEAARRIAAFGGLLGIGALAALAVLHTLGGVEPAIRQVVSYAAREGRRTDLFNPPPVGIDLDQPLWERVPPGAPVNVRWAPQLSAQDRAARESRYRLERGQPHDDVTWRYHLTDTTPENVEALVKDPQVEDTAGIDRRAMRVDSRLDAVGRLWSSAFASGGLVILPGILTRTNATAWLYCCLMAMPIAAVGCVLWRRGTSDDQRRAGGRVLAAATLLAGVALFVLRSPIPARLGGVVPVAAVLAAGVIGLPRSVHARRWPRAVAGYALWILALASLVVVEDWPSRLNQIGVTRGPGAVLARARQAVTDLTTAPPSPNLLVFSPIAGLADYLRACTRPEDRLLATWFAPELYFYADRGFAAGMIVFFGGHWSEMPYQRRALDRLRTQSVPLVIVQERTYEDFASSYPLIDDYLRTEYEEAGRSGFGDSLAGPSGYRVLARRGLQTRERNPRWGLPCFP